MSFLAAIGIGTVLLLLPLSTHSGHISFVDALFTSTSAVCVTGLTVQNTATYFSRFGQAVILFLFQMGGLGIMTFSTLILLVAGKKISIQERIIIKQDLHHASVKNVAALVKGAFIYALTIEAAGALFLYLRGYGQEPRGQALFSSVFHAVSAFCNAGFSVFQDSFVSYKGDVWVNAVLILLIVLGGLGFLVLSEGVEALSRLFKGSKPRLSLHAKLVGTMTLFLIVLPFFVFLVVEWEGALAGFSPREKVLTALFQVITPRTAGFNTMDLNSLSAATVFLMICLMFIGASPGSTGGGVKTCTVGVLFAFVRSKVAARDTVGLFYRTLPSELVMRAFTVVTLGIAVIFLSSFLLFLTQPGWSMREVFFEVFSAFGTVGLSLGITPKLTEVGKVILVLTMFIGRIGPLSLLYAFSRKRAIGKYAYVEESVMIG